MPVPLNCSNVVFRFFNQGLQSQPLFDLLLNRINVKPTETNFSNMRKLLCYPSIILILSTFNSCSPDDEPKTITVELISELPIGPMASQPTQARTDYITLISGGGSTQLTNQVPNNIGENMIVQTFTALPLSNSSCLVQRGNGFLDILTAENIAYCGNITINVYSDEELFHTVTKEMGGIGGPSSCPDGSYYSFNFIVPE
jgi:hypothetical protein